MPIKNFRRSLSIAFFFVPSTFLFLTTFFSVHHFPFSFDKNYVQANYIFPPLGSLKESFDSVGSSEQPIEKTQMLRNLSVADLNESERKLESTTKELYVQENHEVEKNHYDHNENKYFVEIKHRLDAMASHSNDNYKNNSLGLPAVSSNASLRNLLETIREEGELLSFYDILEAAEDETLQEDEANENVNNSKIRKEASNIVSYTNLLGNPLPAISEVEYKENKKMFKNDAGNNIIKSNNAADNIETNLILSSSVDIPGIYLNKEDYLYPISLRFENSSSSKNIYDSMSSLHDHNRTILPVVGWASNDKENTTFTVSLLANNGELLYVNITKNIFDELQEGKLLSQKLADNNVIIMSIDSSSTEISDDGLVGAKTLFGPSIFDLDLYGVRPYGVRPYGAGYSFMGEGSYPIYNRGMGGGTPYYNRHTAGYGYNYGNPNPMDLGMMPYHGKPFGFRRLSSNFKTEKKIVKKERK